MIGEAGAATGAGGAAGTAGAASSTGFGGSGGGAGATIGEGASAGATISGGVIGFFFTGSSFGFGGSTFGFSTSSFGVIRLTMIGAADESASRTGAYCSSAAMPATCSATTPIRLGALVRRRRQRVSCGSSRM